MKIFLCLAILLLTVACKDKSSVRVAGGEIYLTYSTDNSHSWTIGEIEPVSLEGAGRCSISGSKVVYTKTDLDFSGVDYCMKVGETNPMTCNTYSYRIDFSILLAELEPSISGCL